MHFSGSLPCSAQVLGLGLLDEAAMLLSKGISSSDSGAAPGSMAGKAVGYRQAIKWMLQVADAEAIKRKDVVELVEAICSNTHKLVRHQMTWFRDNGTYKVGVFKLPYGLNFMRFKVSRMRR
eukprot:280067-Pelagomonas_calceolata.AAC.5